jgi:hypothetical protein
MPHIVGRENIPPIKGYNAFATHDCPQCGEIVRIAYVRSPDATVFEPTGWDPTWTWAPFSDGLVAIKNTHINTTQGNYYYWGMNKGSGTCGFTVPRQFTSSSGVEPLPQAIYASLVREVTYKEPRDEIVRFDLDAFRNAPFVCWAPARERDVPPLLLIAEPMLMRRILHHGVVPKNRIAESFSRDQLAVMPDRFLALISAVTAPTRS